MRGAATNVITRLISQPPDVGGGLIGWHACLPIVIASAAKIPWGVDSDQI